MKIVKVECLPVHPGWRKNLVFVRIETSEGVVGWGEAYSQYDRDGAIAAQVESLGQYLVGREAWNIRHFLQVAYDGYAQRRSSLEFWCAVSGLEQALWDIAGKVAPQPVYKLLGGTCRPRIRVHANGWSYKLSSPADFAAAAEKVVKQGFDALKFDPLPQPWRTHVPREHIRHAIAVVKAVQESDIYWFEEPCPSENLEALGEVRRATNIPVVSGEALYGRADFRRLLGARCVDIINPDVSNCGGILELSHIAAAAEAELVAVSPHNYNSTTLSLSATVHAAACMPNFIITEYFLPYESFGSVVARNPLVPKNGYIDLPTGPGLGLEIDEDAVRSHPGKSYAPRSFRSSEDAVVAGIE